MSEASALALNENHQGLSLVEEEYSGAEFQKRARIIYHATEAFFSYGYDNANLQDIALAAGVGKVTIYRFFTDKDDLFKQVIVECAKNISESLDGILDPDRTAYDNLVEFAIKYTERLLRPISQGHRYFEIRRLMLRLSFERPEIDGVCRDIFSV